MGDDSLSIVVSTADGTLNSTDVAKITDIAMTETGYAAQRHSDHGIKLAVVIFGIAW